MSQIKVDTITDQAGTGAPDFTNGIKNSGTIVVQDTLSSVVTATDGNMYHSSANLNVELGTGTWLIYFTATLEANPNNGNNVFANVELLTSTDGTFTASGSARSSFVSASETTGVAAFGQITDTGGQVDTWRIQVGAAAVRTISSGTETLTLGLVGGNVSGTETIAIRPYGTFSGDTRTNTSIIAIKLSEI